jgi:hypothetical protein
MLAKCIIMKNISGGFALICQRPILQELNYFARCHFRSEPQEALLGGLGREGVVRWKRVVEQDGI